MAVRSYTPGKMTEEAHKPRGHINRANKKTAPTENSKTQRRKRNLDSHKRNSGGR